MADPCIGCGFTVDAVTGELEFDGPRSDSWSYVGDLADCNGLACDPATNEIWAPPDQTTIFTPSGSAVPIGWQSTSGFIYIYDLTSGGLAANPGSPFAQPAGADLTTIGSTSLTNTSDCRDMGYVLMAGVGSQTSLLDAGVGINITPVIQVDGGGFSAYGFTNPFRGSVGSPLSSDTVGNQNSVLPSNPFIAAKLVLTPGQSVDIDIKIVCSMSGPGPGVNGSTATPFQGYSIGGGFTISLWGTTL